MTCNAAGESTIRIRRLPRRRPRRGARSPPARWRSASVGAGPGRPGWRQTASTGSAPSAAASLHDAAGAAMSWASSSSCRSRSAFWLASTSASRRRTSVAFWAAMPRWRSSRMGWSVMSAPARFSGSGRRGETARPRGVRHRRVLGRRLRLASLQRVVGALVQAADLLAAEPLLADLQVGADQEFGRELLHREPDGIGRVVKSLVADRLAAGRTSAAGEELRLGAEIEGSPYRTTSAARGRSST